MEETGQNKKKFEKMNRTYREKNLLSDEEVVKKAVLPCQRNGYTKKLIKKGNLRIGAEPVVVNPGKGQGEAIINLNKKNGIVEFIEVICPCGNKIKIACRYGERELRDGTNTSG